MGIGSGIGGVLGGVFDVNNAYALDSELGDINPFANFSPENYGQESYAGDFNPTLYDTPEAAQYQTVSDDPRVRQVQMDALQSLIDRSNGAADAQMQAQSFGALDEANQLAKAREDSLRQEAARRGQGGAGMDAVLRAQASQAAANRARLGTQQAVTDAALQKLAATQGAMSGADQMRGRDFQLNAANAGIINDFNRFNTAARNAARQANVGVQNQAGMRNLNTRQALNGSNTNIRNASLDRSDRNKQRDFGNRMQRFGIHAGLKGDAAQGMGQIARSAGETADSIGSAAMAGVGGGGAGAAGMAGSRFAGAGESMIDDDWTRGMA